MIRQKDTRVFDSYEWGVWSYVQKNPGTDLAGLARPDTRMHMQLTRLAGFLELNGFLRSYEVLGCKQWYIAEPPP